LATPAGKGAIHVYLFEQIAMGNLENIANLLVGGVPVDITDGFAGNDSTLHWATSFGHVDVVKVLLVNGFDVNKINNHKQSALHVACKNNYVSIAEILILEGADVNAADVAGSMPFNLCPVPVLSAMDNLFRNVPAPTYYYRDIYTESIQPRYTEPDTEEDHRTDAIQELPDSTNTGLSGNISELVLEDDIYAVHDAKNDEGSQMLVLWPPVQRQGSYCPQPLVLTSASPVLISVASTDIEIYPLLTASGLLDALDSCGLQSQVKRSSPSASIRLAIDKNIIPGINRFEIKVTPTVALITASDACGLVYAVSTFVQILQLHSTVGSAVGMPTGLTITTVSVPSIVIQDWPDFIQRAVSLTFRSNAQLSLDIFTEYIQLFSRIRLNTIILTIDTTSTVSVEEDTCHDRTVLSEKGQLPVNGLENDYYMCNEVCCIIDHINDFDVHPLHTRLRPL
jgi:hypothetical protein